MNPFSRFTRYIHRLKRSASRQRTADMVRQARRERDLCRKCGWTVEADFCQFRARCYMLGTYL